MGHNPVTTIVLEPSREHEQSIRTPWLVLGCVEVVPV